MRTQLPDAEADNEYAILKSVGSVLVKYANKYLNEEILESYQLATLLMLIHRCGLLKVNEFAEFRYDLECNHVIVTSISAYVLELLNLAEEDGTFRFCKPSEGLKTKIDNLFSTRSWPTHLRGLIRLCFEYQDLFSIMNFVFGCHYWDAYSMYHLIINRKVYILTEDILFNTEVTPTCYLPDIPDTLDDIDEYLQLFKKLCNYLPSFESYEAHLKIETPSLAGMITKEMWELSDKFSEASEIGCYRYSNKMRLAYLDLTSFSECAEFIRNSFYDFGIII